MSIYDKLEEIRKKPEHIRMRYVWMMVIISMVFVIAIWIFSLKGNQENKPLIPEEIKSSEIVNQFKEQKETLKGVTEGFKSVINQQ